MNHLHWRQSASAQEDNFTSENNFAIPRHNQQNILELQTAEFEESLQIMKKRTNIESSFLLYQDIKQSIYQLLYPNKASIFKLGSTLNDHFTLKCQINEWARLAVAMFSSLLLLYRVSHSVPSKSKCLWGVEGSIILLNYGS